MAIGYMLAEEFLKHWKTYALIELKRDDGEDDWDAARRLDTYSRLLFEGNREAKELALELLGNWTRRHDAVHPMWLRFKMRRILYLHELNRYPMALKELDAVMELHKGSPALYCLRGNILGYQKRYTEAIKEFETAIGLADRWSEPQHERIEKLILNGQYGTANDEAAEYLERGGNNNRDKLILRANQIIARMLNEPQYPASDDYHQDRTRADQILLPGTEREKWTFKDIREHLSGAQGLSAEVKTELSDWLHSLETRLAPQKVD